MIVLGIDPGYAIVGYGAIHFAKNKYIPLGFGAITTTAHTPFNERLEYIYDNMVQILNQCHPDAMAIETLYFQNNQKTAIDVAQARGVIMLAAQKCGVEIFEYTPLQVKTTVTGYGQAKKPQVMEMTRRLLKLDKVPKPDDTADALAIAICHTQAVGTPLRKVMLKGRLKP
ncbi:MAG TPA: crossover junction endodeoxyribonuclease RuvC [Clostridiales bacterium]|nr:crossover junction endodeoxyribonuclease RuvC [Clostridiales bacterium]